MITRSSLAKCGILLLTLVLGVVAGISAFSGIKGQPAQVSQAASLPSWNPYVSCNAVQLTEEQFVGSVPNPTQPFPRAPSNAIGADYSGGGLRLAGNLPAGSNPASWPYSKRSVSPPCQVTLSNGTAVPTFVEIHNVVVGEVHLEECGTLFPGQCDRTFNVCDYSASQCLQQDQSLTANNYTTTMFQHHNELDMAWNNSGLIPASQQQIQQGMKVDLQGFVFWDSDHLNISYHSFSGWELHPLTAWRLTGSPSVIISSTPSPAMAAQTITFTGNIVGGSAPYNGISWTFGDGNTASCQTGTGQSCSIQHGYAGAGNYTLTASTSDSTGKAGSEALKITVLPFAPSFTWSPTNSAVGQIVSFNGTATAGTPPYSFSWNFGDGDTANGPVVNHVYLQSQFFTVKLSVTDSLGNTGAKLGSVAVGSWNPRVDCSPITVRITDITDNMTGSASLSNSIFNPGITSPVGTAKRWLTPGIPLPGWVSPGPPCTVTNSHGTTSVFVEIDGVKRGSITTEDCVTSYDKVNGASSNGGTCAGGSGTNCGSYCDSTFNTFDPSIVPSYSTSCTSASDPTCNGRIHTEIDHDWKAAHYCGASTTCDNSTLATQTTSQSTLIDIQGFVSWDPGNLNQQWHSFNGWEIHPLTGWRVHRNQLTVGMSVSPSTPTPGQGATFTATLSGGTGPYMYTWDFGDGMTTTGSASQVVHIYGSAGAHIAHLYVVDSLGANGPSSKLITIAGALGVSFTFTNPAFAGAAVTFNATAIGGVPPYSFNWNFGDNATGLGATTSHTYATAGTYRVLLTGGDSNGTTATSTQNVAIQDFTLVANPTNVTVSNGQTGTSTITVTGVNGFTGAVGLSARISPASGLTCTLSPTSVTGSGTSNLGCTASSIGTYTVTATSASGPASHSASITYSVVAYDFSTSASPTSVTVIAGSNGTSTITVSPVNGFTGTVTLAASVSPSTGLSCLLTPTSIILGASQSSNLFCSGSGGNYTVTVTGTSGSLSHSATIAFAVQDFGIGASPTSLAINVGQAGTSAIAVTSLNGFNKIISLSDSVSPSIGLSCNLNPTSVTGSGSSTLSCTALASGGYTVTIIGAYGSLTRSTGVTYTVTVPDFSVAANPTNANTLAGGTGSSTITVSPINGFTGTVTLAASVSPGTGLSCNLNPANVTLGPSQTSTLSCSGSAGSYSVTVTGTSGSLTHSVTVGFAVGDFSVTSSPTSFTVLAGQTLTSTITVSPLAGFTGTVNLSLRMTPPSGLSCNLNPTSVILGASQTSTLSCSGSVGVYSVNVTGTSGALSRSTILTVTVQDFAISANPNTVVLPAGSTGTSRIAITGFNGFSGNITLSTLVTPGSGLSCTLQPTNTGPSGNSTLSCDGSAGVYTVTVTGTSGSLSHSTTVSYTVQDFSVTANPTSTVGVAGAVETSTITVSPLNSFSGNVTLTGSITPQGLSCVLSQPSIFLGSSQTSLLSCSGPAGTYSVTVTGASGSLSHSAMVTILVQDFTISASPTTVSLEVGSTGSSSISVSAANGFAQLVALSASVSPSTGLSCTLTPSSITGSGSSSLFCFPSTSGAFNVTVTGTSGSLSHSTAVTFTAFVPTQSPYALMATYDGRVYKYYANGTNVFLGKPVGSALRQVAWKPDGSYALIVGDQGVIFTYNGIQLTRFSSAVLGTTNLNTVAWRPDGSYALIGGANGLVFKYNGTTVTQVTDPLKNNIRAISWNPTGNSALLVGDKGTALIYQTSGQITAVKSGTGQPLFAVAWNPNGAYALAGGGNGVILRYNGTAFAALSTTGISPAGKNVRFIAFNPTGSLALLVGDSGLVVTYDGTRLVSLVSGTNNNLYSVSWSGGTAYIVGQNGTLLSYSPSGTVTKLQSGTTANLGTIAWKPT